MRETWILPCVSWGIWGWTRAFWLQTTIHKDLTERLPRLNPALYRQVRQLLDINKAERHIRGGLATRKKYKGST